MARTYTPAQREEALRLYVEVGPAEAARRLEMPAKTISSWARDDGIQSDAPQKTAAAVEAARLTREQKRELLRDNLLDKCLSLVDEMDEQTVFVTKEGASLKIPMTPANKKDLATATGILIDKFRLEVGEATSRNETTSADEFTAYLLGAREAYDRQRSEG